MWLFPALLLLAWVAAAPLSQHTKASLAQRLPLWRSAFASTAAHRQSLDITYEVKAEVYTNRSVGSVLVSEFEQFIPTLAVAYDLCSRGHVSLNGRKVYSSNKVKVDDLLAVSSLETTHNTSDTSDGAVGGGVEIKIDEHRLDILLNHTLYLLDNVTKSSSIISVVYEDDSIAIVDKPNCLHTRKFAGTMRRGNEFTLYDVLPLVLTPPSPSNPACYYDCLPSPQPVHRLDKKVSGCIVIAKTNRAMMSLHKQFERKTIRKEYKAMVFGSIVPNEFTSPSQIDGNACLRVSEDVEGLPAETLVLPLGETRANIHNTYSAISTVSLFPITGRRHQLREHCARALRCPIVGDDLYCDSIKATKRHTGPGLFLYCRSVSLTHPLTQELMTFEVAEPKRFGKLISRLHDYYLKSGGIAGPIN